MSSGATVRDPAIMQAIDEALAEAAGGVPGFVAVAADEHGSLYEGAFGLRDLDRDVPMTADAIFRLASMTKTVTSIAAMQLVERGLLELDAPVESYLPAFGRLQVLDGFDGDRPVLRPPAAQAIVRQLFTHTAGVAYDTWNANILRYDRLTGSPAIATGLRKTFLHPLVWDPGTHFEYGTSTDWLGLVIEAVSGVPVEAYFEEHIVRPLGLPDTGPLLTKEQRGRLVPIHARRADGSFVVTEDDYAQHPEFYAAGHCLYSTARDFLVVQRALLGGGVVDGVRVLEPSTVDEMFRNQIGNIEIHTMPTALPNFSCDLDLCTGKQWGLGLMLEVEQEPGLRSAGSGGWAGIWNTFYWVDRSRGVTGAIYMQFVPFLDPEARRVGRVFEEALYRALR